MKCSSHITELTNWAIDHPGAELPERLAAHVQDCPFCRSEWEALRGWVLLLRPKQEIWQPDEGFFERLTEQAMREKRRAALTESTRRDLALDVSGVFSLFQRPLYRWLPTLALFLLVVVPLGFWFQHAFYTIGEFDFSSGQVIAQADRPLDPRKGMSVQRNTSVQTPQNSESIVHLESGADVCVAELSRVTFLDSHTVRVDHGKAYFDISKQKSGFVVQLPYGEVQVLGTAFEIAVTKGNASVSVTRGVVQVSSQDETVRVERGMTSDVVSLQRPSVPRPMEQASVPGWVVHMQDQRNQEELRKYYPSLAAPTPKGSKT